MKHKIILSNSLDGYATAVGFFVLAHLILHYLQIQSLASSLFFLSIGTGIFHLLSKEIAQKFPNIFEYHKVTDRKEEVKKFIHNLMQGLLFAMIIFSLPLLLLSVIGIQAMQEIKPNAFDDTGFITYDFISQIINLYFYLMLFVPLYFIIFSKHDLHFNFRIRKKKDVQL